MNSFHIITMKLLNSRDLGFLNRLITICLFKTQTRLKALPHRRAICHFLLAASCFCVSNLTHCIVLFTYPSPRWEIFRDRTVAQFSPVSQRYNRLMDIIKDVILLAECDFVVCTLYCYIWLVGSLVDYSYIIVYII